MYVCVCGTEGVTHKFVNRDFIGWFIRNSQCVCAIVCNACTLLYPVFEVCRLFRPTCSFYRVLDPFVLDPFVLDPFVLEPFVLDPFILSQIQRGPFKYLYPVTQLSASQ
jgi:hypothetical protein